MRIHAAVIEDEGRDAPFVLQDLELDEPRSDELLVRMVATGVCHSDLTVRDPAFGMPRPVVLGHEGAGVVEAVGTGVTKHAPGDHVLLSFGSCGVCDECADGRPKLCVANHALNLSGARPDGTTGLSRAGQRVHGCFFGQSSFATHALTSERNATRLDPALDLTVAPAFACGVQSGAGAVLNGLRPAAGASIAILGVGAVGMAALLAARLAGCGEIVAIDRAPERLALAAELGATLTIDASSAEVVAAVRARLPRGVHHSVEATGVPAVLGDAVAMLRKGGTCALLGVAPPGVDVTLPQIAISLGGVGVQGFPGGLSVPDVLVPRLVELHLQGRFPVDRLVTRFPFEGIDRAIASSKAGAAIKPVLTF